MILPAAKKAVGGIGSVKRMAEYKRSQRVADLLQRVIAELLYRRVRDPRLARVTINGVDVTPDLRMARVYYCFVGTDEEKAPVADALERAKGFIRREVGLRVHLRYTPELVFHYDTSFEYSEKIDHLLRELRHDE